MTDENTNPENSQTGHAPTHRVYHIRKYGENNDKSYWTEVGVAWANKDGNGFNLQLNMVPLDGNLTIRPPRPK